MWFEDHLWFEPSRSDVDQGCVEVALTSQVVGVRDTKNREAGHFTVDAARWGSFVDAVKAGILDR